MTDCASEDILVSSPVVFVDVSWETGRVSDVGTTQSLGCTSAQPRRVLPSLARAAANLNGLATCPQESKKHGKHRLCEQICG